MTEYRQTPPTEHQAPPASAEPPPSSEWDFLNGARASAQRPGVPDLTQVFLLLDSLRRIVPQELQDQFNALAREVLLTIRALIDWYLERLEQGPAEPQVEDIPID